MSSNILKADNGVSSGTTGLVYTAGNDGTLQLATTTSGGSAVTALTIDNNQIATFANKLTAASMPTGSVVQVVNSSYYTYASTSSTSFLATGLTASITPQFSTSKILVLVNLNGMVATLGSVNETALYRSGSLISYIDNIGAYTGGSQQIQDQNPGLNYLDSPSTTSATTYTVYWKVAGSAGTIYINNFYTANGQTGSTITLMEIR